MDKKKLGVVECLYKVEVACCDEDVVACFDEGLLACLDKNNKYDFDVYFLHAPPLEYILEEILGRKCLFQHSHMQKIF